jgi:tRNA threonylcarbamoyladenosine biosynthesis protein TsaB
MILALKTDGANTGLWLYSRPEDKKAAAEFKWESGKQLSTELLGRILELLKSKNQALSALTAIVIFSGPGSFTSLRIGHTTANSLADSLQIPVVGSTGEDWLGTGLKLVESAKPGVPVLPLYGSEPNVTRPKS